jgi:hypothetical protein
MPVLAANKAFTASIQTLLFPHGNAFVVYTTLLMCFVVAFDLVGASNDIL